MFFLRSTFQSAVLNSFKHTQGESFNRNTKEITFKTFNLNFFCNDFFENNLIDTVSKQKQR